VTELRNRAQKPAALADWAYATIKEAILNLDLPMGSQVKVEELAEQMGVSRTPIREALLSLEKDGLVRAEPRVGFFVTDITPSDLEELFEIRQLLEGYAVKRAASRITDADLARLARLLKRGETAVKEGDLDQYLQVDIDFHTTLMERAPNRHLSAIMGTLQDLTYRERILSLRSPDNVQQTLVEHRRILDALSARDGELAGQMMAEHMARAGRRLSRFLELPSRPPDEGSVDPKPLSHLD